MGRKWGTKEMIGFFIKSGDSNVSEMFRPYVWGIKGWESFYELMAGNQKYGTDLELLLIKYYIAGQLDIYRPDKAKLLNYSKKDKDIAVDVPVEYHEFHYCDDKTRRIFIVDSIMNAIAMVRSRLEPRGLDINFDELEKDAKKASDEYLKVHNVSR
jgi:hypothetical protein